ncbi:AsnC family transcriptional regulator [Candidatus Woesearchaeota archaeon CG10_big_fil_rev_8_21_14_0_10_37_12]|nr:MAG: AsnC family transcriptional regulator [Candidatus Woesearchaeota archaeon CG10_big_fil_rev_8_21_14_0_10_37_12]
MKLDDKDRAIIRELLKNSKQTTSQLGKKLNMPITTVHNRIKKLEKEQIIRHYTVNLDYKKLGQPILAFIGVTINYQADPKKLINQTEIAKEIKKISCVQECTIMTGGTDLMVKVLASDIMELNDIVTERLRNIVGVDKTQTAIVLKEV